MIENMSAKTGRMLKEDDSVVNIANLAVLQTYARENRVGADQILNWSASGAVNTTKTVTFAKSANNPEKHEIIIANQSSNTALNVDIGNIELNMGFNNATDSMKNIITSVVIPASTATAALFDDETVAFTSDGGANVVCSTDVAVFKVGVKSAKIAVGAGFATGLAAHVAITSTNFTQYSHLYAWVYSDVALAYNDYQFTLDDTNTGASPLETALPIPAIPAATWTRVRIPLANPDTDLAIICLGLNVRANKGAVNFYVDDVRAVKMSVVSTLVRAFRNGADGYIKVNNATALTTVQEFNAKIRVKELG